MPAEGKMGPTRMDHCIDSIRQSLMCSSDIKPLPYASYPRYQMAIPATGVIRRCREFDALREWARERQSFIFNISVHVDDPFGNIVI